MSIQPVQDALVACVVPEALRLQQLPRFFGPGMLKVENSIFDFAAMLSNDYEGCYWQFHTVTNGAFYMTPPDEEGGYNVVSPNGWSGNLDADAFGITVCLFAYSHCSFTPGFDQVAEAYHLLREFACQHPRCADILQAID
jgi:hypothetical protein